MEEKVKRKASSEITKTLYEAQFIGKNWDSVLTTF